MTTPLTKLIAENKERPIAEAPRDGNYVLISGGVWSVCSGSDEWVPFISTYLACKYEGDDYYTVNDYFYVKPTHFRPLPDDRLALVAECLDDGYQTIIKHFPETEVLVNKIREKANRIVEGKE